MISRSELHLSEKSRRRGLFGSLAAALAIGLGAASSLVLAAPAAAVGNNPMPNCVLTGDEARCSFTYYSTGAEQTFTVPDGITSLDITLVGGSGGSWPSYPGGAGASVTQSIAVTPGQSLYVLVAGNGQNGSYDGGGAGGYNGGGWGGGSPYSTWVGAGGGGGSDIRTVPQSGSDSLSLRTSPAWRPIQRPNRPTSFSITPSVLPSPAALSSPLATADSARTRP
ncbi:hypothetical protein E3O06_08265 [Cryobacterium glaciale]|uniref:receptor protein-tyrosine kinase n=1 Tax=Cryobacterium glaciale TaxID=1259145 RepID=A0A4V3I971_9MICO|nr:hypothetical protein E3O06_08265 [Cryobacterium glaciale]